MDPVLDLTLNSLIIQSQKLGLKDREDLVGFIAERLLGVKVSIEASPIKNLEDVFNPTISIKETGKIEKKLQRKWTDDELEVVIYKLISDSDGLSANKISELSGVYIRRVSTAIKDLVERGILSHVGRNRTSRYQIKA
jgi:Fic family protein